MQERLIWYSCMIKLNCSDSLRELVLMVCFYLSKFVDLQRSPALLFYLFMYLQKHYIVSHDITLVYPNLAKICVTMFIIVTITVVVTCLANRSTFLANCLAE